MELPYGLQLVEFNTVMMIVDIFSFSKKLWERVTKARSPRPGQTNALTALGSLGHQVKPSVIWKVKALFCLKGNQF